MSRNLFFVFSLAVLAAVGLTATQSYSKVPQAQSSVEVPILKLSSADGHWARTPIIDGQRLTWENETTRAGFSFVPVALDDHKFVRVTIERFGADGKPETLETLKLAIGAEAVGSTKSPFKVEIERPLRVETHASLNRASYESAVSSVVKSSPGLFAQCCVTCLGPRICAECSVQTDLCCCCTSQDACCAFCI